MNSKTRAKSTDLMCLNCGYILSIYRISHKQPFHVKDMWCPSCKQDVKFLELKDRDIMYYRLLSKENKNDLEKYVFDILDNRRKNEKGNNRQLEIRK